MTDHVHGLTEVQVDYLLRAITADRIKTRDGQSHVEAWDVRRTLIRAFGFGGYDIDRLACDLIDVNAHPKTEKSGPNKGKPIPDTVCYTVIYRYEVRLTVKCSCGHPIAHYDEVATGDAINLPGLGAAHDFAVKTAESQALKRAATNLGDQFGLSLYNKRDQRDPVVQNTALRAASNAMAALPTAVTGGEMDDQPEQPVDAGDVGVDLAAIDRWIATFKHDVSKASTVQFLNTNLWPRLKKENDSGRINSRQYTDLINAMGARKKALEAEQPEPVEQTEEAS